MTKHLKILVLRLGAYFPFRALFSLLYRLTLKLASYSFHSVSGVNAVLLRGSAVTGHAVPGLSDLDFEVLTEPMSAERMVTLALETHRRSGFLQKLFPMIQSPFIRTEQEWTEARQVPHEWLSHSSWRVVRGSFSFSAKRCGEEQEVLPLFRLCLRELTKTIPQSFFRTPDDGTLWPARINRDRLQFLEALALVLGQSLEESDEMNALEQELRGTNFLTRKSAQLLGRHLVLQRRALNALAPSVSQALSRSTVWQFGSDWLQAPPELIQLSQYLERLLPPEVKVHMSSCGNRYSQFKLYLIPPDDYNEAQLAELLAVTRLHWQKICPSLACCLSYPFPILLSTVLLPLVGLGFCSSFEGTHLHISGAVERPDQFLHLTVEREMVDGVFLLRKKLGLIGRSPDRFYRYLQDYFVGVYPALFLARHKGRAVASPREAVGSLVQSIGGEYVDRLANYLEDQAGLEASSRAGIEHDPLTHLRLLESFHRETL